MKRTWLKIGAMTVPATALVGAIACGSSSSNHSLAPELEKFKDVAVTKNSDEMNTAIKDIEEGSEVSSEILTDQLGYTIPELTEDITAAFILESKKNVTEYGEIELEVVLSKKDTVVEDNKKKIILSAVNKRDLSQEKEKFTTPLESTKTKGELLNHFKDHDKDAVLDAADITALGLEGDNKFPELDQAKFKVEYKLQNVIDTNTGQISIYATITYVDPGTPPYVYKNNVAYILVDPKAPISLSDELAKITTPTVSSKAKVALSAALKDKVVGDYVTAAELGYTIDNTIFDGDVKIVDRFVVKVVYDETNAKITVEFVLEDGDKTVTDNKKEVEVKASDA